MVILKRDSGASGGEGGGGGGEGGEGGGAGGAGGAGGSRSKEASRNTCCWPASTSAQLVDVEGDAVAPVVSGATAAAGSHVLADSSGSPFELVKVVPACAEGR